MDNCLRLMEGDEGGDPSTAVLLRWSRSKILAQDDSAGWSLGRQNPSQDDIAGEVPQKRRWRMTVAYDNLDDRSAGTIP